MLSFTNYLLTYISQIDSFTCSHFLYMRHDIFCIDFYYQLRYKKVKMFNGMLLTRAFTCSSFTFCLGQCGLAQCYLGHCSLGPLVLILYDVVIFKQFQTPLFSDCKYEYALWLCYLNMCKMIVHIRNLSSKHMLISTSTIVAIFIKYLLVQQKRIDIT